MYHYDLTQWLLFFFVYAFFGWIWESCYVSVRNKRWVNRGFLNGPFLPIYGFGAIAILWATLPVRNSPVRNAQCHDSGICDRRRHGAAVSGSLLGLQQA